MEVKLITGSFVVRLSSGESVGFIVEVCSDILTDFRLWFTPRSSLGENCLKLIVGLTILNKQQKRQVNKTLLSNQHIQADINK